MQILLGRLNFMRGDHALYNYLYSFFDVSLAFTLHLCVVDDLETIIAYIKIEIVY